MGIDRQEHHAKNSWIKEVVVATRVQEDQLEVHPHPQNHHKKVPPIFHQQKITAMHEIQFWGLTLMGGIPLLVAIITKPLVPSFFHLSWGELLNRNRRRRPLQRQGESTAWGRSTARGTP